MTCNVISQPWTADKHNGEIERGHEMNGSRIHFLCETLNGGGVGGSGVMVALLPYFPTLPPYLFAPFTLWDMVHMQAP